MTAAVTSLILAVPASQADGSLSGAAGADTPSADSRAQRLTTRVSAPEKCPRVLAAVRFYSRRIAEHAERMGARADVDRSLARKPCPRYFAAVLKRKARAWRVRAEAWVAAHTLRDFDVRPGYSGWQRAVDEAQRAYPGTRAWLLSCSSTEGGWGRWVLNDHGAGGWMQFLSGTFWRMWAAARADVTARGFLVPRSAASWQSPLGQALAGAWGLRNGRRGEWYGSGC